MIIINLIIILVIGIGISMTRGEIKEWELEIDKKEHKLYFLYPLAYHVIQKAHLTKFFDKNIKVKQSLQALHITRKIDRVQKIYWSSKISLVIFVLFISQIFSIFYLIGSGNTRYIKEGQFLTRPAFGEGEREVDLTVHFVPESEKSKREDHDEATAFSKNIALSIGERKYNDTELSEVIDRAKEYIDSQVLGANTSFNSVNCDLNFVSTIPGLNLTIEWETEDYGLIDRRGRVYPNEVDVDGVITSITAIISCQGQKVHYIFPVIVKPKELTREEKLWNSFDEELKKAEEESSEIDEVKLPNKVDDYHLIWKEPQNNTPFLLFGLGILASIMAWFSIDQSTDKKMKQRDWQLLLDYPEIVNKFTLFMNAGMTIKQAWYRIVDEYAGRDDTKKDMRYAYEEMLLTAHELKLGVNEITAYEQYGKRVGLLPYMKFSTLIIQNLKKGNKGLVELLMKESLEAFEERKEMAKRLGEEAGTKLMLPMMIMLIIVLLIIIIPAFLTF